MPQYYSINESSAAAAWQMAHMSDYKTGSATAEYRAAVDEAAALVEAKKGAVSPFYHDKLDSLLDTYARRLAAWTNDYNRNGASCPSVMISGAGNFPTRKKEKQIAREGSLWEEYKSIQGLLEKISAVGSGPVDLADPHAREILEDQRRRAQKLLDDAKAGNAFYRKHKTLEGCPGVTAKDREWLTREKVYAKGNGTPLELHGCPFPAYELTSRREKIKRIEARIAQLDKLEAQKGEPNETEFPGGRIIRNLELNRLQIEFDGIPDAETRETLKAEGFRWSPKNQTWQRQLTDNALRAARRALKLTGTAAPPQAPGIPAVPVTATETPVNADSTEEAEEAEEEETGNGDPADLPEGWKQLTICD